MSITITKETREVEVVESITCDSCKRTFDASGMGEDCMEVQEFLRWSNTGGYDSIFGDGTRMTLDLCQSCQKKLLGDVIQFHEDEDLDDGAEEDRRATEANGFVAPEN